MTRSRLIQVWFAGVVLIAAAGIAMGVSLTAAAALIALTVALAPPAMVLLLWPGVQPKTAGEVLRGTDRQD